MNLDQVKAHMQERDFAANGVFKGQLADETREQANERVLRQLADDVPDLVAELERVNVQNEDLRHKLALILCGKENPDGEWTPELRAAHAARIEFMEALGGAHYSRTDAKWHVDRFRKSVLKESSQLIGELRKAVEHARHCEFAGESVQFRCESCNKADAILKPEEKPKCASWKYGWRCMKVSGHAGKHITSDAFKQWEWT